MAKKEQMQQKTRKGPEWRFGTFGCWHFGTDIWVTADMASDFRVPVIEKILIGSSSFKDRAFKSFETVNFLKYKKHHMQMNKWPA